MNSNCLFCGDLRFSLNKELSLPADDSVVYQDEHIFIIPDLYPLAKGHFLIVTKEHYASSGSAPNCVLDSIEAGMTFLIDKIFVGCEYTFFEHGSVLTNTGGSSIDHVHIHALPYVWKLKEKMIGSPFIYSTPVSGNRETLISFAQKKVPYIYLREGDKEPVIFPVDKIPSQFMRILIAREVGVPYDWKSAYSRKEASSLFMKTLEMYKEGRNNEEID